MTRVDQDRSLEDIDGHAWGDAPSDATNLVASAHSLRRKPLRELTTEDLRLLLGQGIGPNVLVPLALDTLRFNPMAEGDMYPGDLLNAVLRLPAAFWRDRPLLASALHEILAAMPNPPSTVLDHLRTFPAQNDGK